MPVCACFHNFESEPNRANKGLRLSLDAEGSTGLLRDALESSGLAASVESSFLGAIYNLSGVRDADALDGFLSLLRRRIVIALPDLDACYALGPYSVFDVDGRGEGVWRRAEFGEAVHRAKYAKDQGAVASLSEQLTNFVNGHPGIRSVAAVAAPPKSDPGEANFPLTWAKFVAESLGVSVVSVRKTRPTGPQKDLEGLEDEQTVADRVRDSVQVDDQIRGDALVIDDTIRSGGTVRDLGRALKAARAGKVYALCVAKDAKFTIGGISLGRERWL